MHVLDKETLRRQLVTAKHQIKALEHELEKYQQADVAERIPCNSSSLDATTKSKGGANEMG